MVTVGVGEGVDEQIWIAIATALARRGGRGFVNGILIGALRLNALIVTLAVGQIVAGVVNPLLHARRRSRRPVPTGLSDWVSTRILGVTRTFWMGVALTVVLIVVFRLHGGRAAGSRWSAPIRSPRTSPVSG